MIGATLSDRVCVVTGAASGIGRAIAEHCRHAGATAIGLDVAAPCASADAAALRRCDVTDEDAVAAALESVVAEHGGIDALFACAGIAHSATAPETTRAAWDRVLAVNLTGVFLCAKHAIPRMRPGGAIVVIASMSGLIATDGEAAYCAAKAGTIGLARALAVDHAPDGIRVNAVCPGVIDTPMNDELWAERGDAFRRAVADAHPVGRFGTPAEVASVATFLAAPESGFVTGAVWTVDGGYTAR
jgi:NAD(P)-dependent dehydrogenase (short-subunit alcohol dehydrogenase family)